MQDRYQEIYRGYRWQVSPGAVILQVSRPRHLYL